MLSVILSTILFNIILAKAAISPNTHEKTALEVPFYKSSTSLFPSGSTTIINLKKQLISSHVGSEQHYKWNKLYFSKGELKPVFASHLSRFVIDAKTNERLKVTETNINSLQLFNEKNKTLVIKNREEIVADAYDTGFVMALKDIYLKTNPQSTSTTQTTIPQGTRLVAESFINDFALVKYQNYQGYVNLSELITKFDFSSFVFAKNQWHQVKHRQFDKILTVKNKFIYLNEITGLITPENKGIVASNTQKIPLWSAVELVRNGVSSWNKSNLKEYGHVWWKTQVEAEKIYYSIDELLKKDISSVSFNPKNPLKGLLSADGVYITEDGNLWRKLTQFENFNGPVHYFNDLLLFVGNFRSSDAGATFDNYIQIDKLASAIEFEFGFSPKKLQVKKIDTSPPYNLKIEIETGSRKIKMESPLFTQNWKATKG